ncbi:MAG: transcription antitermination factor NusB [Oscillospiraceae bacterium]
MGSEPDFPADRSHLQLALFECQWVEDVPVGVAVNEAVTLAKKYDGDDAGTFVNGILRSFLRGQEQAGTEAPSQEEAPRRRLRHDRPGL